MRNSTKGIVAGEEEEERRWSQRKERTDGKGVLTGRHEAWDFGLDFRVF